MAKWSGERPAPFNPVTVLAAASCGHETHKKILFTLFYFFELFMYIKVVVRLSDGAVINLAASFQRISGKRIQWSDGLDKLLQRFSIPQPGLATDWILSGFRSTALGTGRFAGCRVPQRTQ